MRIDRFFDEVSFRDERQGFKPIDNIHLYNEMYDVTLVKKDDQYYAEMHEEEDELMPMNGNLYIIGPTWYLPVNFAEICKDIADNIDPEDFAIENY